MNNYVDIIIKDMKSLALICLILPLAVQSIDWQGNWAPACDFKNTNYFARFLLPSEECGPVCGSTSGCTHYTWNQTDGGTCWMKAGKANKEDTSDTLDHDSICGVIDGSIKWNGTRGNSCDFPTEHISNSQASADECRSLCKLTKGCTNYVWTQRKNGTCWLKRGQVAKDDAFFTNDQSMVCGLGYGVGDLWVSFDQFTAAVTGNGYPGPSYDQYEAFIDGISQSGISSIREMAMFLAQMIHESAGLTILREIRCQDTGCIGEYPPPGPNGVVYYGRGYIQLTWDFNYRPASQYLYNDESVLLNDPDIVANDQYAAWGSAFWYWATNVHYAPGVQDGLFGASTKAINGALECSAGWNEQAYKRFQYYCVVLPSFGVDEQPNESGCYN